MSLPSYQNIPPVVFDIDMTLTSERYFNDDVTRLRLNKPIAELARSLGSSGVPIVISTARPEKLRIDTTIWLTGCSIPYSSLYMRKDGDERPDPLVKADQATDIKADYGVPVLWYDDNPENCSVIKRMGIPCIQVVQ